MHAVTNNTQLSNVMPFTEKTERHLPQNVPLPQENPPALARAYADEDASGNSLGLYRSLDYFLDINELEAKARYPDTPDTELLPDWSPTDPSDSTVPSSPFSLLLDPARLQGARLACLAERVLAQHPDHALPVLMDCLAACGWKTTALGLDFDQGEHEFIYAEAPVGGCTPYVIDFHFKELFCVARPTVEHECFMNGLRRTFVGPVHLLEPTIAVMCAHAKRSLGHRMLAIPPWRSKRFLSAAYQRAIGACRRDDALTNASWTSEGSLSCAFIEDNRDSLHSLGLPREPSPPVSPDPVSLPRTDSFDESLWAPVGSPDLQPSPTSLLSEQLSRARPWGALSPRRA
eukprot:EG_transcript_15782